MPKRPRIAVVGSANVDLTTFTDHFPRPGETIFGDHFDLGFGGKGANVEKMKPDFAAIEEKIWLGDSVELIKMIPDESFHAVITDPPFGINLETRKAGEASASAYEDSEESYERLLSMAPDIYRVLKKDGWLIWFFGISWYDEVKKAFRAAGFTVDEIPVIWNRSDGGRSYTARPDRWFGRGYDVALHAIKGEPEMIVRGKSNVITIPPVTQAEKAKRFFRRLLRSHGTSPRKIVTDKLGSYGVAHRALMPETIHSHDRYANNRAELSHQPTRARERAFECWNKAVAA